MLRNPRKADQLLTEKGFSRRFTDYLITTTEIDPPIRPSGKYVSKEPNWLNLEQKLKDRYGNSTSNRLIVSAKFGWYVHTQDWPNAVKYSTEQIDSQVIDTSFWAASNINGIVYNIIFKHGDDLAYLKKGLSYMEAILKTRAEHHPWIDTYANLLYKTGRKEEAIAQEEKALALATQSNDINRISIYKQIIKKMRADESTWEK